MNRSDRHGSRMLALGAALAVATMWASVRASATSPGPVGAVQARSRDAIVVDRQPVDDAPALRPTHPPIELIPPIPIPAPGDGLGPLRARNTLVHDALTGETSSRPVAPPSGFAGGAGDGYFGADGDPGWEGLPPPSFGDMTLVNNPYDPPWRMNCKLVMRFVDELGNTRWFTGSGAMIDAETVITAAHCVYARETDTVDIYDWAEEIWVYPGWDGVGGQANEPPSTVHHFGFGRGTQFMAGADYVDNGDHDGDCALVRITRGVGMLTGWYGYTWGYSCTWIQDRTYHNASFPSEDCPIGGLHNGSDMYYWFGTVDSCPFNQMQLDTGGGHCFDTVWGGMSGSGMYWIDGDRRRVHSICSTSNRDDRGRYCILWEEFVTDMIDSFVPASRGSTFDLQALDVNVDPVVIAAGSQVSVADVFVANPTNASASGTWTYRVYLSTNDNISGSDVLLDTLDFDFPFGPMGSTRVSMWPTIPISTPPGDYWLGVILDPASDAVSANNDTDGWDAAPITIVDHCFAPPSYDATITPSDGWQTIPAASLGVDGCRVFRMELFAGNEYDFSLCGNDGVGGWADPGDADLRMYDQTGTLLWYIDGFSSCGYDASTIGTVHEGWSPPTSGTYYLEVSDYYDEAMEFQLAHRALSTEHCYALPDYDLALSPASSWRTTPTQSIDAPGGCRVYRMYLSKVLDYDFSLCANDSVGGWASPGDADLIMLDEDGNMLWYLLGVSSCGYDATTIGSAYEEWTPSANGHYYLKVIEHFDQAMTYRLAYRITPGLPPPNDDCGDVTPVPLSAGSGTVFDGINVGATVDSDLLWPEVWHAFTTTECVNLTLRYCNTTPAFGAVYWILKDECPAFGPNVFSTSHESESCGNGNWTMVWEGLPPGTYWYPVLSVEDNEGPYFLTVNTTSCEGCTGDVDLDNDVDFQDLIQLLSAWGPCFGCPADLDSSGTVDFQDLILLLSVWGPCG